MRTPRLFIMTSALASVLVAAGVYAAQPWSASIERVAPDATVAASSTAVDGIAPIEQTPLTRRAGSGALLQDLRSHRQQITRLEEPPRDLQDPDQTASLPSLAPLPPLRPAELAALPAADVAAPLPPARPKAFAAASFAPVAEPRAAEPAAAEREAASASASAPLALAALLPSDLPSPFVRRDDGNFRMGAAAFVRIFKKEGELELWLKRNGRYSLYRAYPICKWSGHLGPKLQSGDYQSPEGFYSVSARQLNPNSAYHRAFNIGFPNAFDRQNGRTGGALMVHGACKSVGCFAMTDKVIEEIYGFVEGAIRGGQHEVPVHIFPFRLTESNLARETAGDWTSLWSAPVNHQQWNSFWQNLKEGYDLFEKTGEPPTAYACGRRYAFGPAGGACTRIAGW